MIAVVENDVMIVVGIGVMSAVGHGAVHVNDRARLVGVQMWRRQQSVQCDGKRRKDRHPTKGCN